MKVIMTMKLLQQGSIGNISFFIDTIDFPAAFKTLPCYIRAYKAQAPCYVY